MKVSESPLTTELEDFQENTSDHVFRVLKRRPIYSIADQVGLGKTWVVADVLSRRFNERERVGKKTFVFYVAPSDGLLKQNIKRIYRYIQTRTQAKFPGRNVVWYSSRLSTLLLESENALRDIDDRPGGCIHIVGLTSDVSFKLTGTGTLIERAFLCAIFLGASRKPGYKQKIGGLWAQPSRWFFLLDGRPNSRFEAWYNLVRAHFRNSRDLIEKVRSKLNFDLIFQEFSARNMRADPRSAFIRIFRKHVTLASMEVMKITDVVLDEWHRYSGLCADPSWGIGKKKRAQPGATVLPLLLEQIRSNERDGASAILVSATPFVVRFEGQAGQEDIQNLAYIELGKEKGEGHFQEILKCQGQFLRAVQRASDREAQGKSDWREVEAARKPLQEKLLDLTVRTERPLDGLPAKGHVDRSKYVAYWSQADLLIHVADPTVLSPVPALWSDSRLFVEKGEYKPIQRHWAKLPIRRGKALLSKTHWKIQELQKDVDSMLLGERQSKKRGKRKPSLYPPLWLRTREDSTQGGVAKVLIFSEFTVTPHEVSDALRLGPSFGGGGRSSRSFSHSIYGWFPDYLGDGRSAPEKTAHSWVHFFPLLAVETLDMGTLDQLEAQFATLFEDGEDPDSRLNQKIEKRDLIWQILALDYYLLRSTAKLRSLSSHVLEKRIAARAGLFGIDLDELKDVSLHELRTLLQEHHRTEISALLKPNAPGVIFARAFGKIRKRFDANKVWPESLEQSALNGAEGILRLFSTAEAQLICKDVYNLSKERVEFVRQYCADHKLGDVLDEYFELLEMEFRDSEDPLNEIMAEFNSVVTLGRGKTHQSRYVRPYSDSRSESEGSEKKIATSDLRSAFNSPFPPYVLVTTSIGQEGIDFHRYCRKIVHWSAPHCPSALQQREGRLDRYQSLQVREAIRYAERQKIKIQESGFSPNFTVLTVDGERLNSLERKVLYLPFSQQEKRWERCLERSYLTGILVGTPDPLSVELRFRSLKEKCINLSIWENILKKIKEHSISLEPPPSKKYRLKDKQGKNRK